VAYQNFPSSENKEEDKRNSADGRHGNAGCCRGAWEQEHRSCVPAAADPDAGVAAGGDRARGAVLGLRQHAAGLQLAHPLHAQHAGRAAGRGCRQVGEGHTR